jgi:hypothetical protein
MPNFSSGSESTECRERGPEIEKPSEIIWKSLKTIGHDFRFGNIFWRSELITVPIEADHLLSNRHARVRPVTKLFLE